MMNDTKRTFIIKAVYLTSLFILRQFKCLLQTFINKIFYLKKFMEIVNIVKRYLKNFNEKKFMTSSYVNQKLICLKEF